MSEFSEPVWNSDLKYVVGSHVKGVRRMVKTYGKATCETVANHIQRGHLRIESWLTYNAASEAIYQVIRPLFVQTWRRLYLQSVR